MLVNHQCFVWNVRGLNERARRNVVREFLVLEKPTLVCLQETKLPAVCNVLAAEILGVGFDYACLPSVGASGGILLGWRRERWTASDLVFGRFALSARLKESPWAIKAIDKLRRAFIWAGSEVVASGKCKVAWPVVCLPRQLGGLGVSDLRRVGVALRVRWV
jgi:hypothetical protein